MIEKRNNKFVLISKDGRVLGTHRTKTGALTQEKAVEADTTPVKKTTTKKVADKAKK